MEKITILIKKASLAIEKIGNPLLIPYDLTHAQYKILKYLYENEKREIRQVDLEQYFSMTNPTVTGIIQNLEKKKLIERVPNPNDKRSKLLSLTEHAYSLKSEMYQLGDSLEKQVVGNLTEMEREQLITLLNKVLE